MRRSTHDESSQGMKKGKTRKGTDSLPFRDILQGVMKERGLTVRQVAELAAVSSSVVSNWLEGRNPHDLKAISRLAQGLGVSFKSLLLGEREEIGGVASVTELFREEEWFDGLARVSIKRLVPRNGGKT